MDDTFDPESHVNAMAETLGLDIDADWEDGVVFHLAAIARAAAAVAAFPLDGTVEPAWRFEA